jgi:hypothetical protein
MTILTTEPLHSKQFEGLKHDIRASYEKTFEEIRCKAEKSRFHLSKLTDEIDNFSLQFNLEHE